MERPLDRAAPATDHRATGRSSILRWATPAAALLAIASLASCLLAGYDKAEGGTGGAGGATASSSGSTGGSGGASSSSAGGEDRPLCDTTREPAGPDDAEPGGTFDVWLALRSIDFGDPADEATVPGFDLDRAFSCRDDCASIAPECARPDYLAQLTEEQAQRRCDWPSGVDNTGIYLFRSLASAGDVDADDLSAEAEAGDWSLLLRLSAWNGQANDAQVTVSLYSTVGFERDGAGGGGVGGGGGAGGGLPTPLWNGTDRWTIDSRALSDPFDLDTPTFQHTLAYVSDGVLVAQVDGTFFAGSTRLPVKVASGLLVAPLVLDGPSVRLAGATFGGRWAVDDVIGGLGPLIVDGTPFCEVPFDFFATTMKDFCRLVDVTSPAGAGTCNAISLAFRFDADEIQPGEIVTPTEPPDPCPPLDCETLLSAD